MKEKNKNQKKKGKAAKTPERIEEGRLIYLLK